MMKKIKEELKNAVQKSENTSSAPSIDLHELLSSIAGKIIIR